MKNAQHMLEAEARGDGTAAIDRALAQTRRLEDLNGSLNVALQNMPRGLSMFDADRRLVVCNALYREIYDIPEQLAQPGTPFEDLVEHYLNAQGDLTAQGGPHDAVREDYRAWIDDHIAELRRTKTFMHTQRLRNGRVIQVTNQALADGGWVDVQEDVTAKALAQERTASLSRHCSLTECPNLPHFIELLDEKILHLPHGEMIAVHLIDLDHVKRLSDAQGSAAGEALLRATTRRIRATVREGDIIGRVRGDQIAVAQRGIVDQAQAERLAQRLVKVLNAPYRVLGANVDASVAIGISLAPKDADDAAHMLKRAEVALYRAKSSDTSGVVVFDIRDEQRIGDQMLIEVDLQHDLLLEQLELHYQPIIDLQTRKVLGVEALMRWCHPKLGPISPATFIPIAESTGRIHAMGAWALSRACADAMTWTQPCKVTVNISALQIERGDVAEQVRQALEITGLPPDRLELEITESIVLGGGARTRAALDAVRNLGVRVALDDFGTAFASLSYLRDFSFDKLKIDRSFISSEGEGRIHGAIVNAVAGLARALDIGSVAEGVETAAQLKSVTDAGCHEVQGYLFSPAVPSSEIDYVITRCSEKLAELNSDEL